MALIVRVYINNTPIIEKHATRIKGKPGELCMYRTDTGKLIMHHYDDGGAELAVKLLRELNDTEGPISSK